VKISPDTVRYVAELSNLKLTEAEIERFAGDMSQIIGHMDKLNELDTSGVEPMTQVLYEQEETATLREDTERETLGSDVAVANAPVSGAGHFKVPRVIDR